MNSPGKEKKKDNSFQPEPGINTKIFYTLCSIHTHYLIPISDLIQVGLIR